MPWGSQAFFREISIDGSALCFYLPFSSKSEQNIFVDDIKRGVKRLDYPALLNKRSGTTRFRLAPFASNVLRFCPVCADVDAHQFGIPHWRVAHQLPGVHHCPDHQTPLHGQCSKCTSTDTRGHFRSTQKWRLPGQACSECGHNHFATVDIPPSPAYSLYLSYCSRIVRKDVGLSDFFRPDRRDLIFKNLFPKLKINSPYTLRKIVLKNWRFDSTEELSRLLETEFDETVVYHTLATTGFQNSATAHLIMRSALEVEMSLGVFEGLDAEVDDPLIHRISADLPIQSEYLIDLVFHGRQILLPDDATLVACSGAPLAIAAQGQNYHHTVKARIKLFGHPVDSLMDRLQVLKRRLRSATTPTHFKEEDHSRFMHLMQSLYPEMTSAYFSDGENLARRRRHF